MKIGIFSDPHYSSAAITCGCRYNNRSLDKIKAAYCHFESEGCRLVVCLGDLIDTEKTVDEEIANLKKIADVFHGASMPTVALMGNHDAFTITSEQFYDTLGLPKAEHLTLDGRELFFLDTCYFKSGKHYAPGDSDWTDCYCPDVKKLEKSLAAIDSDAYIFMHHNTDIAIREDHRLANAEELMRCINQSGKVKAVFQGHYHGGHSSIYGGIPYITLPAMCQVDEGFFVYEI